MTAAAKANLAATPALRARSRFIPHTGCAGRSAVVAYIGIRVGTRSRSRTDACACRAPVSRNPSRGLVPGRAGVPGGGSPLPSRVATAGQTAGETAGGAVVSAGRLIGDAGKRLGGFFARGGKSFGRMCADLSVGLGRYCRRVFVGVFTDFQEKPAGTPLRYDQM